MILLNIELSNVNKIYPGGFEALKDISFKIKSNQVLGLCGPNGAGKTTLLKILKGILTPTTGIIRMNGENFDNSTDVTLLKKLSGYLAEDHMILQFLTVNEYLELIAILYEIPLTTASKQIEQLLKLFNLLEKSGEKLKNLSEGMRQKVLWIATLIPKAPLIILDDPLQSLDVHSLELITDLIDELKKLGKTIIIATHYLALVERVCDKIVFLQSGEMLCIGSVGEICELTETSSIYDAFLKFFPNPIDKNDVKQVEL